nr:MAG TPA: hypothetical protein [Caudoviricetes sp.]
MFRTKFKRIKVIENKSVRIFIAALQAFALPVSLS